MLVISTVKTIHLTQNKKARVSDNDYHHLCKWRWFAARTRRLWYAVAHDYRKDKRITVYMHRVVAKRKGLKESVDHRDCDGLNNMRSNLRSATAKENSRNRGKPANNTSGFKGVEYRGPKQWRARIRVDGRLQIIGTYTTRKEAAREYNKAATHYFGKFAWLNSIA